MTMCVNLKYIKHTNIVAGYRVTRFASLQFESPGDARIGREQFSEYELDPLQSRQDPDVEIAHSVDCVGVPLISRGVCVVHVELELRGKPILQSLH